jgi:hypothetical protein
MMAAQRQLLELIGHRSLGTSVLGLDQGNACVVAPRDRDRQTDTKSRGSCSSQLSRAVTGLVAAVGVGDMVKVCVRAVCTYAKLQAN